MAFTASPPNLSAKSPKITGVLRLSSPPTNTFRQKTGLDYILAEAVTQLALTNTVRFGYYFFSPSRRRPGPMLPQAPEFDRFLRPCPIGQPRAGCTIGPGLRRDGVICSEGAMKANWITASFRRDSESGNCQFFIS